MRIVSAETIIVGNPPPYFGGRYFIIVKLTTDDGITGIGEVYCATFGPETVRHMIADVVDQHVIDADPFHIEHLWHSVYGRGYSRRPDISLVGVLSGIEMACWDIVGKAADKPVYELLGGLVHERLRTYTYLYPDEQDSGDVYSDGEIAAQRAAEYVASGFTAVKFDPVGPYSIYDGRQPSPEVLEHCTNYTRRVREAVGSQADLLFGTHGQFTPSGAIRLAQRLEPFEPLWFEEPTPPENPAAMAQVARQTSIPIATGERLTTRHEFARVLETGAAAIIQMALGRSGGLLDAKKIAALAETAYAQIAPHLYCGPVAAAANVQLAACTPNFLILEGIKDWRGFHAELLHQPIEWQDGYVLPPKAPGLGIELDEAVAAAHPYTDDMLHLQMRENPVW